MGTVISSDIFRIMKLGDKLQDLAPIFYPIIRYWKGILHLDRWLCSFRSNI